MKLRFLLLILAAIIATAPSYADNKTKSGNRREKPSSEQLAVKQACYIANSLNLDSKETQKFIDAYSRYQSEAMKIKQIPASKKAPATDADAEKLIKNQIESSEQQIKLHKKYYQIYSSFLTQTQIWNVYQLEKKIRRQYRNHNIKSPKAPTPPKAPKAPKAVSSRKRTVDVNGYKIDFKSIDNHGRNTTIVFTVQNEGKNLKEGLSLDNIVLECNGKTYKASNVDANWGKTNTITAKFKKLTKFSDMRLKLKLNGETKVIQIPS